MKKLLTFAAAALVFATLAGTSAFADQRYPERTYSRDNDRIAVEGRITRVFRDRDGFRVELDRGRQSYWIPEARLGGRDLRVGISVRIGGVFRDGIVVVDDIGYPAPYGYENGGYSDRELRGIIDRVNYRLGYLILRERDGDFIKVDMRPVSRYHREPDLDDLRRGDAIAISGDWSRDGLFRAERVDRIRRPW